MCERKGDHCTRVQRFRQNRSVPIFIPLDFKVSQKLRHTLSCRMIYWHDLENLWRFAIGLWYCVNNSAHKHDKLNFSSKHHKMRDTNVTKFQHKSQIRQKKTICDAICVRPIGRICFDLISSFQTTDSAYGSLVNSTTVSNYHRSIGSKSPGSNLRWIAKQNKNSFEVSNNDDDLLREIRFLYKKLKQKKWMKNEF